MILEEIKSELKHLKTASQDLQKFGVTMAAILGILAALTLYKGSQAFPYLLVLSVGFLVVGFARPLFLKKVYLGWMALAIVLGFVMTRVILTILFYGVVTVVGALARLSNSDMLDQQYDAAARTYWKPHQKPQSPQQHLERQF